MASNSTSTPTTTRLECSICFDLFKTPKILPCFHTFCLPCLEQLVTHAPSGAARVLRCPTCRKENPLPDRGVAGFQENFYITEELEARRAPDRNQQQGNVPPVIATVRQGRQPSGFSFHANHGENVELSDNQQTAERVRGDWRGIVLSIDPMVVNALYEVTLEQIEPKWRDTSFLTGVTNQDPSSLMLPTYAGDWDSAIVIKYDCVRSYGRQVQSNVGRRLADLPAGARIGLLVDGTGCLHVYRDGQSLGVAVTNITHPVYAFFEVRRRYKKVKALPLTFRN